MPYDTHGKRRWLALYEYKKLYPGDFILYPKPDFRESPDTCKWCGGKLSARRKSYCSEQCASDFRRCTDFGGRGQSPLPYRILCRDYFTCQKCGVSVVMVNEHGIKIPSADGGEVHHIIRVVDGGTDSQWNLETLCEECHKEEHGREAV